MAYTTIDDPSAHFNTLIWSGNNASSRSFTGLGFSPDWTWIKSRSDGAGHGIFDSVRGVNKRLDSGGTGAEITDHQFGRISSFDSDGFTVEEGTYTNYESGDTNMTGRTYVGWSWRASDSNAVSNTDGSITSTVSANTTAGFSIVTYVSNNTEGATFGHGLNSAPDLVIVKGRDSADNWAVFNGTSTTNSRSLHLESSDAEIPVSSYNFWNLYWDETRPSSTVVTLGVDAKVNKSGNENFVAYCFHSVKGYSKIGKYTGNGNADGTFVYTGFRPAYVLRKCTTNAEQWHVQDTKRLDVNNDSDSSILIPSNGNAEASNTNLNMDILSNGFKCRSSDGAGNGDGRGYIYMAFAEHPFVSSKGVPVTAR
jgi:hypothetical protein